MISPAQCRAARALLQWSQQQLAEAAKVGVVTIRQFEAGAVEPRQATVQAIQIAAEQAGISFPGRNSVHLARVIWNRTQDGESPPSGVPVMVEYTIGDFGMQPAIFDAEKRIWNLPAANKELLESEVQQWTAGPWYYATQDWEREAPE
ncbi:helix-turn-helix domain-containing protein [Neorhizobium tomejilense]|uniref:helix-turn-helix domain-containing protein n=1 Tax=Neorhizobium tomejilense TaxID=2093828 RepID=UPI000CFA4042|nr:helix-turn-helix transcriptional regulator [Neorhizobium tomejilense]